MNWGRRSLDARHTTRPDVAVAYLISTLSEAKLDAVLPSVQCCCPQCYAYSSGTTESRRWDMVLEARRRRIQ